MQIKFLGAAETVTGSAYLIETSSGNFLIDYGMFQGPDVFQFNYDELEFDPSKLNAVFLTHGHIDHCGRIPQLYKEGFKGKIYCTPPTKDILKHILIDSANVQEKNLKYKHIEPLYRLQDSQSAIINIIEAKPNATININEDINIKFVLSSHILGAASIEVRIKGKTILFSGDLGRIEPRIIEGYDLNELKELSPDYVVMEALYGNKNHIDYSDSIEMLKKIVNDTLKRGGNALVPVFSLHRSQEIIHKLHMIQQAGEIPKATQIFFDSPLGDRLLTTYLDHTEYHNSEFRAQKDPFGFNNPNVTYIKKQSVTRKTHHYTPCIIVAGGGMLEGGKALYHLKKNIDNPKASLIFTGFQAEGTLGRTLLTKPKNVSINNKVFPVNISIHQISGFSAHADANELLFWLNNINREKLKEVFLVHAEPEQSGKFKELVLENFSGEFETKIPKRNETFVL